MTTIESVFYVPAGESIDAAVGEKLWDNKAAIERFVTLWEIEARKLIGCAHVCISSRCDFANASKLTVGTDAGDDDECRGFVGDMLDRAFETASAQVTAEYA
jgi:hypothetical protein